MEKALKKEWDDAVIAVSIRDRRRRSEIKKNDNVIPFSILKDIGELAQKFKDHPRFNDIIRLANDFMNREIHMVSLSRETDLERIVETFERINRTGEPLSIFELLLETMRNYDKINRWYWASVFSNRYDQAVDTTSANDFTVLNKWVTADSKVPHFIQKLDFDLVDLDTDKQSFAIYRGVISMIVLKGALDFKTGQPPQFGKEKIQDDHIFSKSVYKDHRIINRTLISTNAEKSDKKPSEYFRQKLNEHGKEKLKMILESDLIPEEALDDLLNDHLQNFIEKRKQAIINNLRKLIIGSEN